MASVVATDVDALEQSSGSAHSADAEKKTARNDSGTASPSASETLNGSEAKKENYDQNAVLMPRDLKEEFLNRTKDDNDLLLHYADHVLDVDPSLTVEEIDKRLEGLRQKKKITVLTRAEFGFDMNKDNFALTLDNAIKMIAAFTKADVGTCLSAVLGFLKGLGYERLSSKTQQRVNTVGLLTKTRHSVTIVIFAFVHQAATVSSSFPGFLYGNDRVNCHQCLYQIVVPNDNIVKEVTHLLTV